MNNYKKLFIPILILVAVSISASVAHAMTPTLTLSVTTGDSVQLSVTGDPNYSVIFYYNVGSTSGMRTVTLGTTSSSGTFSTVISTSAQGILAGNSTYVSVNGQSSPLVIWPYSSASQPTLSQTSLTLSTGQTATIVVNNPTNSVYIQNNSNPSVATFNVSGTQILINALNAGSTTATVCYQGNSTNCASVYVNVQSASTGYLTFSQSSVSLVVSQTASVTISGGTGSYYISANSNSNVVQATISGSTLSLYAPGSIGNSSITVCSSGNSICGTVSVTVSSSSGSSIYFSQNNLFLNSGQSQNVTIYGGGGYYVASNSNTAAVSTSISGSTVTVYAVATGNSSISVCQQSTSICGTLLVTVNGTASNPITFSQSSPYVASGQNVSVTIYGGSGSFYVSSNSNPNVASLSLSGSTLVIYGNSAGSSSITICSSSSNCGTINVSVGTTSNTPLTFSQSNPTLSIGQTLTVTISGSSGSYYLALTPSGFVQASISGSVLSLYGVSAGSTNLSICSSSGGCGTVYVTVNNSNTGGSITFSQNTVALSAGQSATVTISGTGSYYVSGTQNTSIASVTISGNNASIYGVAPGTTNVTICQSTGQCGSINITVSSGIGNSSVTFSQTNPTLSIGQTVTLTVYGGTGSYYLSTTPTNVQASINGNILTLYGTNVGSTNVSVCASSGGCGTLYVTINGTNTGGSITFSQTNPTLSVGQTTTLTIYGSTGSYYISSTPANVQASINGNILTLYGTAAGSTNVNICASSGGCGTLFVTINSSGSTTGTDNSALLAQIQTLQAQLLQLQSQANAQTGNSSTSAKYKFTSFLSYGSEGTEVTELQKRLTSEGVYSGPITGYYGSLTQAAVKNFQKLHGIDQRGYVGPGTRAELNK